ncbi:MAG TPA: phospholipase D family protein [Syntrophales bacterium]|nr:phospholipase D family protein [Syntrophales bacterium]
MIDGLYANRSSHGDFIKNAIDQYMVDKPNVFIAVAFFTENKVIKSILDGGSRIRLVVRLGFPTDPDALLDIVDRENMEIRYFTGPSFHPKLYIFGDNVLLIGSANLTNRAINSNQEVMVSIKSDDERFDALLDLFNEYWQDAAVLTEDIVDNYRRIYFAEAYRGLSRDIENLNDKVQEKIGRVEGGNITREKIKKTQKVIFIDDYRKTYQECVSAFNVIRSVYESENYRKVPDDNIPLRIEIDSFISYVRDKHTHKESWRVEPLLSGDAQREKIRDVVRQWRTTPWPYFEDTIVSEKYPQLIKIFSDRSSIVNSTDADLTEALAVLHSFHDRRRFFPGGLSTLFKSFLESNNSKRIRESLVYLLYGNEDVIVRMANMIFNRDYKLNVFGRSNVQELIGWHNKEDLPVINGRTTKILRYFGFDVRQLNEGAG